MSITVRDLRRLWKPHKERLNGHDAEHPTNVRFHRACSWLQHAEQATKDDLDLVLLSQWIAFNALYGQWDHEHREPLADNVCWKVFLERMLELDQGSHIVDVLEKNKRLARRARPWTLDGITPRIWTDHYSSILPLVK